MKKLTLIAAWILTAALASPSMALDAFPAAMGPGKVSQGGRGGAVIEVTTLADAVPAPAGSLRACLQATGPRNCVFRVGGVINLVRGILVSSGQVSLLGQTAPGGGVLITTPTSAPSVGPRTPLVFQGIGDVIVRHVRVRLQYPNTVTNADGITLERAGASYIDHVSTSWATDENINTFDDATPVTIAYSMFGEGLTDHSKCGLFGSDSDLPEQLAFVRNLCISNADRNTDHKHWPGSCVNWINNAVYNPRSIGVELWPHYGAGDINIRKSVFKAGPSTIAGAPAWAHQTAPGLPATPLDLHTLGNLVLPGMTAGPAGASSPTCPISVPELSNTNAWNEIKTKGGAFPRDSIDTAFVSQMGSASGTGTLPPPPLKSAPGTLPTIAAGTPYIDTDHDGMPDSIETTYGGVVGTSDPWADPDGDGWSNFDEVMDAIATLRLTGGYPS